VDLIGPLHTLITLTINGNNVSGTAHFQPQGLSVPRNHRRQVSGDGVTKDSSFKASFKTDRLIKRSLTTSALSAKVPETTTWCMSRTHYHHANGIVSVFHDNFSIDCNKRFLGLQG